MDMGVKKDKDHYFIDIEKIIEKLPDLIPTLNIDQEPLLKNKQPDFSIDITPYINNSDEEKEVKLDIVPVNLNGDDRDDIFLFTFRDENSVTGTLFLSQ